MAETNQYQFSVSVISTFLADQSDIEQNHYVFSYQVKITNTGNVPAQLISRHWVIIDGMGTTQEIKGLGVVGAQPLLNPGQHFEYTSGTALHTPVGSMHGTYQIVAEDGTQFDAIIAPFTLTMPRVLH